MLFSDVTNITQNEKSIKYQKKVNDVDDWFGKQNNDYKI